MYIKNKVKMSIPTHAEEELKLKIFLDGMSKNELVEKYMAALKKQKDTNEDLKELIDIMLKIGKLLSLVDENNEPITGQSNLQIAGNAIKSISSTMAPGGKKKFLFIEDLVPIFLKHKHLMK